MSSSNSAIVIVNTKSRRGNENWSDVPKFLEKNGIAVMRTVRVSRPSELFPEVEKAAKEHAGVIAIGGGDGTMSSVAKYFMDSQSILGVVPLGTGNQFARDLSIPSDLEQACQIIANGKVASVDVGVAGEQLFLNVATVGLTTRIAEELTVDAKRAFGRFVYAFALVKALRKVRPFIATLLIDGKQHRYETLQVVIGNGRFHAGPFPIAPDASICDGKLTIYCLDCKSKWALVKYALSLPGGHHVDLKDVPAFSAANIRLETSPIENVTVDGEVSAATPIDLAVRSAALKVMVPQEFEA